jgi:hypothetical protein
VPPGILYARCAAQKSFLSGLSIFSLHKEDTALPEGRSRILVYFLSYSVFRIPAVKLKT